MSNSKIKINALPGFRAALLPVVPSGRRAMFVSKVPFLFVQLIDSVPLLPLYSENGEVLADVCLQYEAFHILGSMPNAALWDIDPSRLVLPPGSYHLKLPPPDPAAGFQVGADTNGQMIEFIKHDSGTTHYLRFTFALSMAPDGTCDYNWQPRNNARYLFSFPQVPGAQDVFVYQPDAPDKFDFLTKLGVFLAATIDSVAGATSEVRPQPMGRNGEVTPNDWNTLQFEGTYTGAAYNNLPAIDLVYMDPLPEELPQEPIEPNYFALILEKV